MTRFSLALVLSVLATAACGGVSPGGPDGGDGDGDGDAQSCPGGSDDAGTCICPPRFVGELCDQCSDGWSGATCNEFNDDFNRGNGDIGDLYVAPTLAGVEEAIILNDRACGDTQSVGLLGEGPLAATQISAEMTFSAPIADGFEGGFILSASETALDDLFLASCDGGGGNCRMRLGALNQVPVAEMDVTMAVGNIYRFTLTVIGGTVSLRIDDLASATLLGTVSGALPNNFRVERFGFITGREPDAQLTCVDDLQLTLVAVAP